MGQIPILEIFELSLRSVKVAKKTLDAIGNTSLVQLKKVVPQDHGRVLVKLEWENPTGSMKDRMAQAVIEKAEKDGRIGPGGTVVTLLVDSGVKYLSTDFYKSS
jgi:cysteine synthase